MKIDVHQLADVFENFTKTHLYKASRLGRKAALAMTVAQLESLTDVVIHLLWK